MSKLLKHQINAETIKKLAVLIADQAADQENSFDINSFLAWILIEDWQNLALKQRIRTVAEAMGRFIGGDYPLQVELLQKVHTEFSGLFHLVFAEFVELYGLEDFDTSMLALQSFTENSSAEFAIRPFIERYPQQTRRQMVEWSKSPNEHLRRLASEGLRPRLPWAKHLPWIAEQPEWVLPIVEQLKTDSSRYVQKSVANLLNDLCKTQDQWVLEQLSSWELGNPQSLWIVRHALRNLLKQGDDRALQLLGYPDIDHLSVENWHLDKQVRIGERLHCSFDLLSAHKLGLIRLEYALYFLRNKQQPYRKVFKISEAEIDKANKHFQCQHNFKLITTRKYVSGIHKMELLVNGRVVKTAEFTLI